MQISGKAYEVRMAAQAVSSAKTICEITAAANRQIVLYEMNLSQESSTTSAVVIGEIVRKTAAATGGTSYTPTPLQVNEGASGFTAKIEGGTAFSAEGTVGDLLDRFAFNALVGWQWQPTPDGCIHVPVSGIVSVRLQGTVPSLNYTLCVKVLEIG